MADFCTIERPLRIRVKNEFSEYMIGNELNTKCFMALSVALHGYCGGVGQLLLQFYYTTFTSEVLAKRFADLLGMSKAQFTQVLKTGGTFCAEDMLCGSQWARLCFPYMVATTMVYASASDRNIIVVAKEGRLVKKLCKLCDVSGQKMYEYHNDNVTGWNFFLPRCFGGAARIARHLAEIEDEEVSPVYLLLKDDCFHAFRRCEQSIPLPVVIASCPAELLQTYQNRQFRSAFEQEFSCNRTGVLALLCRDLFTVLFAEPMLNYCFDSEVSDTLELPMLVCYKRFRKRYLTARTCSPEEIVRQIRAAHLPREQFIAFADAVAIGNRKIVADSLIACLGNIAWLKDHQLLEADGLQAILQVLDVQYFRCLDRSRRGITVAFTFTIRPSDEGEIDISLHADRKCSVRTPIPAAFHDYRFNWSLLQTATAAGKTMLNDLRVERNDKDIAHIGFGLGSFANHACLFHCTAFPASNFVVPFREFPFVRFPSAELNAFDGQISTAVRRSFDNSVLNSSLNALLCLRG